MSGFGLLVVVLLSIYAGGAVVAWASFVVDEGAPESVRTIADRLHISFGASLALSGALWPRFVWAVISGEVRASGASREAKPPPSVLEKARSEAAASAAIEEFMRVLEPPRRQAMIEKMTPAQAALYLVAEQQRTHAAWKAWMDGLDDFEQLMAVVAPLSETEQVSLMVVLNQLIEDDGPTPDPNEVERRSLAADRALLAAERAELDLLSADFDAAWVRAKEVLRTRGAGALEIELAVLKTDRGIHLRAIDRLLAAYASGDPAAVSAAIIEMQSNAAMLASARAVLAADRAREGVQVAEDAS